MGGLKLSRTRRSRKKMFFISLKEEGRNILKRFEEINSELTVKQNKGLSTQAITITEKGIDASKVLQEYFGEEEDPCQ